jgi:DNA ligase-1
MVRKKDSVYQVGRKRGAWWKWKVDPLIIDAVMIYAQKGAGRRRNLYIDTHLQEETAISWFHLRRLIQD